MKKLLILSGAVLALTGCNVGGSSSYGGKLLKPENVYEVDGWGANPDIIEFTPEGDKSKLCLILVSGRDNASGITCFDKKEKQ